jgi:predicted GIY-YIG superfamily endonuclease
MTYNRRQGDVPFSQGQVAVITKLPDNTAEFADRRLTVRLSPPGVRHIDTSNIPVDWKEAQIGPRTTPPVIVGKYLQMGRRTQFPVRYYLCSTIHRIQGDTVPLLATEMSTTKREYKLWQKEQFAVLISRVQSCNDVIFVGSRSETRAAIENILSGSSKWDTLVDHYMSELNVAVQRACAREIVLDTHPFLPVYRELPTAACGYVYMLVSLSAEGHYYVGETGDLKRCLRNHNTGYGAEETRNTLLHPWGVYAFVVGFDQETAELAKECRQQFSERWRGFYCRKSTPDQVYDFGKQLADKWIADGSKLVIVKCGQTASSIITTDQSAAQNALYCCSIL